MPTEGFARSTRRRTPNATACAIAKGTAACNRPVPKGPTDGSGSRRRTASSSSIRRRSAETSSHRRCVVEQIVARGEALRPERDSIALAPNQRDVQIEYTALTFLEPANVRFRYRLDPYDANWVDVGNRRTAFYTKVPPGRYTFRVIASNNAGVWNEKDAQLELSLAPHIWETEPFRAAVALIALFTAAWGALSWRGRMSRRAVELERVVQHRTVALRGE